MTLDEIDIIQLIPSFMREDKTVKGLCAAGNYILNYLHNEIKKMDLYNNLDLQDEEVLDYIAKISNITWYNDNDTKDVKINVIKNSDKVFWLMGTKASVEQVVKDVFGESSNIEEWFEYDGNPKYFKVNINGSLTKENIGKAYDLVTKVKNAQSQVDGFNRTNLINNKRYYASGTVITKVTKVGARYV